MSIIDSMRSCLGPLIIMYTNLLHKNIRFNEFLHNSFVLNTGDLSAFDDLLYDNIPPYSLFHMFSFRF